MSQVESALCEVIRADYPDVEVLMGTSTAGIAHAAIAAGGGDALLVVTGGVGSNPHDESFSYPYNLPNTTAYAESWKTLAM